MKNILIILSIMLIASSCSSNKMIDSSGKPKAGLYESGFKSGGINGYMKISNDTAYIDLVYISIPPEYYRSDTILLKNNTNNYWRGKLATICIQDKKLYLELDWKKTRGDFSQPYYMYNTIPKKNYRIEMYKYEDISEEQFDKIIRRYKNECLANLSEYMVRMFAGYKGSYLCSKLYRQYNLSRKIDTMDIESFQKEIYKMEQELYEELDKNR